MERNLKQLEVAASLNAHVVRSTLGWRWLEERNRGEINQQYLRDMDQIVATADQLGIKLIFGFGTAPCWASGDPRKNCAANRYDQWYPPANPDDYARALRLLVERYGDSVLAWEVWNEPNEWFFWGGQNPDPAGYVALLRAARAAVPDAHLLGAALLATDTSYLSRMYDAGALGLFDALSLHPYAHDPDSCDDRDWAFRCGVESIRATMLAHGDNRPIWLTEFGWSTQQVSESRQAEYLQRSYDLIAGWDYVPVAVWYSAIDRAFVQVGFPGDNRECCFGLIRSDTSLKPAALHFRDRWSRAELPR
jgi:hypothetical protein